MAVHGFSIKGANIVKRDETTVSGKEDHSKDSAQKTVRVIRRLMRRKYSAVERFRIVLEGLGGKQSITKLCRKEGINQHLYYRWSNSSAKAEARIEQRNTGLAWLGVAKT